jgi:LPS export ABC transporter protein LptC
MNKSGLLFLLFAIMVLVVFTWLNSTWLSYRDFDFSKNVKRIDYYLSDFTLLNTYADGTMRYQLKGSHLVHQQVTGASEIFSPELKARGIDNSIITLNAKTALQDKKNSSIQLTGDVSVIKMGSKPLDSFKLLTNDLIYNPIEKVLSTDKKLVFTSDMGKIKGVGFSTHLDKQELRIKQNVHTEFIPAK